MVGQLPPLARTYSVLDSRFGTVWSTLAAVCTHLWLAGTERSSCADLIVTRLLEAKIQPEGAFAAEVTLMWCHFQLPAAS